MLRLLRGQSTRQYATSPDFALNELSSFQSSNCLLQFVRTVSPLTSLLPPVQRLFKAFSWKRAAVLADRDTALGMLCITACFLLQMDGCWCATGTSVTLAGVVAAANVTVAPIIYFTGSVLKGLHDIEKSGVRVVLAIGSDADVLTIAQNALQLGMSTGFAWVTLFDVDKLVQQQEGISLLGWISVTSVTNALDGWTSSPSQPTEEFFAKVKAHNRRLGFFNTSTDTFVSNYALRLYESVFLFAHAAHRVLGAGGTIRDGRAMVAAMKNVSFQGIQQTVRLSQQGDIVEPTFIVNAQVCTHARARARTNGRTDTPFACLNESRIQSAIFRNQRTSCVA